MRLRGGVLPGLSDGVLSPCSRWPAGSVIARIYNDPEVLTQQNLLRTHRGHTLGGGNNICNYFWAIPIHNSIPVHRAWLPAAAWSALERAEPLPLHLWDEAEPRCLLVGVCGALEDARKRRHWSREHRETWETQPSAPNPWLSGSQAWPCGGSKGWA